MYPLNLTKPAAGSVPAGFAVANDAAEHAAQTAHGYLPAYVAPVEDDEPDTKEEVIAVLEAAGIEHDKRASLAKLKALLPK